MNSDRFGPGLGAIMAVASLAIMPAQAQDQQSPAQAAETAESPFVIEEVVVTATKREESLRDIPASIAAFSGADLEEKGKLGLEDFLQETPGVTINSLAPGFTRVIVRGITTDSNPNSPIPSAVGTFIGDTAFTDPYISGVIPDLSAFDISSVEMLKGPQGTIFGGAALAGAVRYVLNKPDLEEIQARGFYQVAVPSDGTIAHTNGVLANLPIVDGQLAVRVAYIDRKYSGSYDDLYAGEEDVNDGEGSQFRAQLTWEPNDRVAINLTHLEQEFGADDGVAFANFRDRRAFEGARLDRPVRNHFSMDSFRLDYDLGFTKAVYLLSYITKGAFIFIDGTKALSADPPDILPAETSLYLFNENDSEATAHELRFQSPDNDSNFKWIAGLYYYDYHVNSFSGGNITSIQDNLGSGSEISNLAALLGVNMQDLVDEASVLYGRTDATAIEKALFIDLSYQLWDALIVTGGARFYETAVEGDFEGKGALGRFAGQGQAVMVHHEQEERGINPKLTATWNYSDDLSFYTQASRGFRFGGIQSIPSTELNGVKPTYKSDSLWNYELGMRSSWLGKSLNFDATIFKIYYTDPQIEQRTPTFQLTFRDNVGSAESEGIEAGLFWLTPLEGLSLSLTGGYTNAYITEEYETVDGITVPEGSELPAAPEYSYSASLSYFGHLFQSINYNTYVRYTYQGPAWGDIVHSERSMDYGELDAGIAFIGDFGWVQPTLSINGKNLTDVVAVTRGTSWPASDGTTNTGFHLNYPRTINIRLAVDF